MADIKLLYFAWVREKVGRSEEKVSLPQEIASVSALITWLKSRDPVFDAAFANEEAIRVAINQQHVNHNASLAGAREIAFFPPVTGG